MTSLEYSYGKFMDYVARLAKSDIELTIKGETLRYDAPKKIVVSPTFFRGDDCYRSGHCCKAYDIVWTREGYDLIQEKIEQFETDASYVSELLDQYGQESLEFFIEGFQKLKTTIVEEPAIVNGHEATFYIDPLLKMREGGVKGEGKDAAYQMCNHLRYNSVGQAGCNIHPIRSLTCQFPHTHMSSMKGTTYLQKQQFGRNWALQCPVKFSGYSRERLYENDIPIYERLERISDDLGVESYASDFITLLRVMGRRLDEGMLPKEPFTFVDESTLDESGNVKVGQVLHSIKWEMAEGIEEQRRYLSLTPVNSTPDMKRNLNPNVRWAVDLDKQPAQD